MIQYTLDPQVADSTNGQIRDMAGVLREIPVTYNLLLEALDKQQAFISSPRIDEFRRRLQSMTAEAAQLANTIASDAEKLVIVSEQARKSLADFDNHFTAALDKHVGQPQTAEPVSANQVQE